MKFQAQSCLPTQPPIDPSADTLQYPDGTQWQVTGPVLDDAGNIIGQLIVLMPNKNDVGAELTLTLA